MEVMTKEKFVRKMMSDRAKVKRENINKIRKREFDLTGYSMNNHFMIEKRLRNMKNK